MSSEELSPEGILEGIRNMTIRGAAEIGRRASLAIRLFAEREIIPDEKKYLAKLQQFAQKAMTVRPTAVTLWSGVARTLKGVNKATSSEQMLEIIRKNSDQFIQASLLAVSTIAEMGARRVPNGAVVLTHCNSTAAVATIIKAHEQGKIKMVYATESRPKLQGWITVHQLAEKGIPVTMIVDSAVRHHMKFVDMVIVGADTIASNGAVINKIGTSQIALIAHERRVPFLVCAETYKFSPQTFHGSLVAIEEREAGEVIDQKQFPGVLVSNPVFDATPAEYVDAIVTEVGVIPATAAYEVVIHDFGIEALKTEDAQGVVLDALQK